MGAKFRGITSRDKNCRLDPVPLAPNKTNRLLQLSGAVNKSISGAGGIGAEAPADAYAPNRGIARCLYVRAGVPYHHRPFGRYAAEAHNVLKHRRIRLERAFIAASAHRNEVDIGEEVIHEHRCALLELVGRYRKGVALILQLAQEFRNARVRTGVLIYVFEVVVLETGEQPVGQGLVILFVLRQGALHELAYSVPNHKPVILNGMRRTPSALQHEIHCCSQVLNGIYQSAVKVKYHQSFIHCDAKLVQKICRWKFFC